MKKAALINASDRTGLEKFAQGLNALGITILATSGSAKALNDAKIPCMGIDEYTGQPEILDGRVKTLHPKIHGGLLAKADNAEHQKQLQQQSIMPIEVAAVNLYPFIEKVRSELASNPEKMIEFIDIGGPTMIRAAAKNHASVLPVIDPSDYDAVLEFLKTGSSGGRSGMEFRRYLASKVFTAIAEYDLEIAKYMAGLAHKPDAVGSVGGMLLEKKQELRYGENPHQSGGFFMEVGQKKRRWEQLNGKELSYNNILDADAALRMISSFPVSPSVAIIVKHANPCGAAIASTQAEALRKAKLCDPRSHFGGIIAFNSLVTKEVAESIREDFAEVVIAPQYEGAALDVLKTSKALRVLQIDGSVLPKHEIRSALDGYLVQARDVECASVASMQVATAQKPTAAQKSDMEFAWKICSHVKSNAIVMVKDGLLIGVGAGQMSRIDSVELAVSKARTHGHNIDGAVAASDAFFPFPDGLEGLLKAGVKAVVAPSGAKRDEEVVAAATAGSAVLVFSSERHFRH